MRSLMRNTALFSALVLMSPTVRADIPPPDWPPPDSGITQLFWLLTIVIH